MGTLRIVFIGSVTFSHSILTHLLSSDIPGVEIVGVVTKGRSSFNADFQSLEPVAVQHGIPCHLYSGNQEELEGWIEARRPDVVYCIGWSHLLSPDLLRIPRLGVVGYHPAALPRNRGRHPIIWALALGLPETASTFFLMDEGADSGDILSQVSISITEEDDAASLYAKLAETAKQQIVEITSGFRDGTLKPVPQNHTLANYWRKRSKADGQIDWRMSARQINNLIRALTRPYPGAHCLYGDEEVKIWKSKVIKAAGYEHLEPGKVLDVSDEAILVKCGEDLLAILDHEFPDTIKTGDYL